MISAGLLAYVFVLYGLLLLCLAQLVPDRRPVGSWARETVRPTVTVFLAVLNESENIVPRLDNVFDTAFPPERLQVIVVSDGSTDDSAVRAKAYGLRHPDRAIVVLDEPHTRGRAHAQNRVAIEASGDILVATDAETRFTRDTLPRLIAPFADDAVGVVGGRVIYGARSCGREATVFARAYAAYRLFEGLARVAESRLGVLVKTDGPCTAYRRDLWTPINQVEDYDQVICLQAAKAGRAAVYEPSATCFDLANSNAAQERRQRARMTSQALLTMQNNWSAQDALRRPALTVALLSHKVLRFASPFFSFVLLASLLVIYWLGLGVGDRRVVTVGTALLFVAAAALLGSRPLRLLARALVASQAGFAVGVWQWLRNDSDVAYTPTRRL